MDDRLRILLIDDDEEEYFFLKELIARQTRGRIFNHFDLHWVATYEEAVRAVTVCQYDLFLVDYHLGHHNGLDVLREATTLGCPAPIIMLTGQGDYKTDLAAMELGAADYLEKGQLTLPLLERSIRYSIERARNLAELQKQAQEIDALQKATSSLLNTLDLSRLLSHILDAAREAISSADQSWLHIAEQQNGRLRLLDEIPLNDARIFKVPKFDGPNHVLKTVYEGHSLLISDAQHEPQLLAIVGDEQLRHTIHSVLIAPLLIVQDVVGAITVSASVPSAFTEDDQRLLSSFAATASTAIYNSVLYAETQNLAIHDSLTGKLNRRTLFEYGQREVDRSRRFGHHLSVLMFDVDHFKGVNDKYGHSTGDKVLVTIAERCSNVIRHVDLLGRYGGDEFAVLLPEADIATAREIANRLRNSVLNTPIDTEAGLVSVSISVGVAQAEPGITKFPALLHKADQALYRSKQQGRNSTSLAN